VLFVLLRRMWRRSRRAAEEAEEEAEGCVEGEGDDGGEDEDDKDGGHVDVEVTGARVRPPPAVAAAGGWGRRRVCWRGRWHDGRLIALLDLWSFLLTLLLLLLCIKGRRGEEGTLILHHLPHYFLPQLGWLVLVSSERAELLSPVSVSYLCVWRQVFEWGNLWGLLFFCRIWSRIVRPAVIIND